MDDKNKRSLKHDYIYIFFPFILGCLSLILLVCDKFSGAEFVSFIVVIAIITLIIKLLPSIVEFTIAGNSVRLREKIDEADRLTKELSLLRVFALSGVFNDVKYSHAPVNQWFSRVANIVDIYNMTCDNDELQTLFKGRMIDSLRRAYKIFTYNLKDRAREYNITDEYGGDITIEQLRILKCKLNDNGNDNFHEKQLILEDMDVINVALLSSTIINHLELGENKIEKMVDLISGPPVL
ncbi:TPA: hypothetical protein ACKP8H_002444 [Serratia marcescens]|uniref:hypothetical protein n=1 Tax=Serratia TaxID=613 RepID=UPI0011C7448B|nr:MULTISPECIES: hypothetical protein [Serratia]TXE46458.1 hypothetical protein FOT55_24770 [Serratia bockelmannii]CAI2007645.1 Uncharacterised protein [Serratia marcescens]